MIIQLMHAMVRLIIAISVNIIQPPDVIFLSVTLWPVTNAYKNNYYTIAQ